MGIRDDNGLGRQVIWAFGGYTASEGMIYPAEWQTPTGKPERGVLLFKGGDAIGAWYGEDARANADTWRDRMQADPAKQEGTP